MSALSRSAQQREILLNLTMREVRSRYKRTVLGNAWSLINPLASMAIYTVVFGFFLRVTPEPGTPSGLDVFALWLMCGLLPWTFLSQALGAGMGSIVGNANLVLKVYLPRTILVVSAVLACGVTFVVEMGVLAFVLLLFGANVLPFVPLAILLMIVLAIFALGLGLMLAVANVYFRDTQHFVAIFLQIWFYLTPILYPLTYIEETEVRLAAEGKDIPLTALFRLNPLEHFVTAFRYLLYDNRLPRMIDVLWCLGSAGLALALGLWVFRRYEGRLAEEL